MRVQDLADSVGRSDGAVLRWIQGQGGSQQSVADLVDDVTASRVVDAVFRAQIIGGKDRVHELAKELGLESKNVLTWLKENGEFVKSASSTVEAPVARRLREAFPVDVGLAGTRSGAGQASAASAVEPPPANGNDVGPTARAAMYSDPDDYLDVRLHKAVSLWRADHHSEAVMAAVRVFMRELRNKAGVTGDSANVIKRVLRGTNGDRLLDFQLLDEGEDSTEQDGWFHLVLGLWLAYRNPLSHSSEAALDTDEAFDVLAFIGLLLRRLDRADLVVSGTASRTPAT